jgi:hypothetical protein
MRLTVEQVLAAIAQSIAVVGPGQVLIVRVDPDTDWEATAAYLAEASAELGVPCMLVVAPQIAVANADTPWDMQPETDD